MCVLLWISQQPLRIQTILGDRITYIFGIPEMYLFATRTKL